MWILNQRFCLLACFQSLGNHEFDDGIAGLAPYLKQVKIPVVACNIDTTKEPSLNEKTSLKKYHMLKVGKVKIAVIGYILPDTKVSIRNSLIQ